MSGPAVYAKPDGKNIIIHSVGTGAVMGAWAGLLVRLRSAPLKGAAKGAMHGIVGAVTITLVKSFFVSEEKLLKSAKKLTSPAVAASDPLFHLKQLAGAFK
eukprot:RCo055332